MAVKQKSKSVEFKGDEYEELLGNKHKYFIKRKCVLLRQIIDKYPGKVLELASGTGEAQQMLGDGAICADFSLSMLHQAGKKGITRLVNADASRLPFKESTFDVIYSFSLFHHLNAQQKVLAIKEARRVLKPNGVFVTFEHNPLNPITQIFVKSCPIDKDAELITHRKLGNLKEKEGFRIIETRFFLLSPKEIKFMEKIEDKLSKLPLGGQYYLLAKNIK